MENKLNTKKYLHRLIVLSWLSLLICFILKIFGANIFKIDCTNENFIAVCNYADEHLWANYAISVMYCFISLYFFTLAVLQERKFKLWQLIVLILTVLIGVGVKIYNKNYGLIFDIWQMVLMPMAFLNKQVKKYCNIIVANILLISFQIVSMYVKNLGVNVLSENLVSETIYGIDILIMLILHYAYANLINDKEC